MSYCINNIAVYTDSEGTTKVVFSFLSAEQVDNDLLSVLLLLQQQVTIKRRSRRLITTRHLHLM